MKKHKPTTPSRRGMSNVSYKEKVSSSRPEKSLTKGGKKASGRNSSGRITSGHRGGGVKRKYRDIDFKYDKKEVPAKVASIEYDPNRSGFIALIVFKDGEKRYILAPESLKVGDEIIVSKNAPLSPGNRTILSRIPVGSFVYNVELRENGGAKIARSAGNYVEVIASDGDYVHLKMPSSEIRKVIGKAWASIGEVSNSEHRLVNLGKAGRARKLGRRPKVRGSAKNPVDHPYGGGEGRAGRGHRRERTKQGRPTGKGQKSRKPKKHSNKFIVKRRNTGKKKKKKK